MSLMHEIAELNSRLMGYYASMSYSYCQLCVLADPSSLLPLEIMIGGDVKHIEDVANIIIHTKDDEGDNVTIDVIYKDASYVSALMQAITSYHPEFKMTLETIEDAPNDEDLEYKYIRLVMPEVDKNRRDLLLEYVKAYHDACMVSFDAMKVKTLAKITELSVSIPTDEIDEAKKQVDATYDQYVKIVDDATEDKKKQIEDAYQEYLENHPDDSSAAKENDGKSGMKMDSDSSSDSSSSDSSASESSSSDTGTSESASDSSTSEKKSISSFGQSLKME